MHSNERAIVRQETEVERICRETSERHAYIIAHPNEFERAEVERAELSEFQRVRLNVRDILRYS